MRKVKVKKHKRRLKSGNATIVKRHSRTLRSSTSKHSPLPVPATLPKGWKRIEDNIDKQYIQNQVDKYGIEWLHTQQRRIPIGVISFGQFLAKDKAEWSIGIDFEDRIKGDLITNIIERVDAKRWWEEGALVERDYEVSIHTHPEGIALPSELDLYSIQYGYGNIIISKQNAFAYYIEDKELYTQKVLNDREAIAQTYDNILEKLKDEHFGDLNAYERRVFEELSPELSARGVALKKLDLSKLNFIPTKADFIEDRQFKKARRDRKKRIKTKEKMYSKLPSSLKKTEDIILL